MESGKLDAFFGRSAELKRLRQIVQKKTASLVVCLGRRRIGKSRLIQEFGGEFKKYIEIQGLGPRPGQTNEDQLDHFAKELSIQTEAPNVKFSDWTDAFVLLAQQVSPVSNDKCLILLDEISWMGAHDPDFTNKLKVAWDTRLKKNPRLCLVVCGSVSSWIQKNILQSTDFLGRISLELPLEELPLGDIRQFWSKEEDHLSELDKLRFLCVTGGVPRYLEEFNFKHSFQQNLQKLCFQKRALLLEEFQKIFSDIFGKRSEAYLKIIHSLLDGYQTAAQISKNLDHEQNGRLTEYLKDLQLSGMIRQEANWNLVSHETSAMKRRYRISDCYLRFYLKFLAPYREQIQKGLFQEKNVESNPRWDVFVGLQFENILLNNLEAIFKALELTTDKIENAGAFFQSKTLRTQACQIDLLIQTRNTLYLCEMKARREITSDVITEVQEKIRRLKRPKSLTVQPVLITAGSVQPSVQEQDYFSHHISFNELFSS